MRRLIIEEPVSRPAQWAPTVAMLGIVVTALATALLRFNRIDDQAGFVALAAGLAMGGLAILLSLLALLRIWQEGRRGLGGAIRGLLLAFLLLGYPAFLAARAASLPALTDVTTDTDNPPQFARSRNALDKRNGYIPPEQPESVRAEQRAAYERIAPLSLDMDPVEAFALVQKAADNLHWQVIDAVLPSGRMGIGHLDAIDKTTLLNRPEDVTVRVRARADGTRVDIRSASRGGPHDIGSNARRIRAFLDEVSTLAVNAK